MATVTGPVRHPKGPADPPTGPDAGAFLRAYLDSSVGAKITVAVTGVALVLFTIFHMIGNLKVLPGGPASRDAVNAYAHFLQHDLGLLLWVARGGLLVLFVGHIVLAVRLHLRSRRARPVGYAFRRTAQATVASRTMLWSGIVIGLFVVFHLAHYTFGVVKGAHVYDPEAGQVVYKHYHDLRDDKGRHDVYEMVVAGFTNPYISALYLIVQAVLFVHLRHGIPSTFQTLGLKNASTRGGIDLLGLGLALFILAGNCAIVLAVWLGYVKSLHPAAV